MVSDYCCIRSTHAFMLHKNAQWKWDSFMSEFCFFFQEKSAIIFIWYSMNDSNSSSSSSSRVWKEIGFRQLLKRPATHTHQATKKLFKLKYYSHQTIECIAWNPTFCSVHRIFVGAAQQQQKKEARNENQTCEWNEMLLKASNDNTNINHSR